MKDLDLDMMIRDWFFDPVYLGFACYSLLLAVHGWINRRSSKVLPGSIDDSVLGLVGWTGVMFVLYMILCLVQYTGDAEYDYYVLVNRIFGPYWFGFWVYPITFLGSMLLLKVGRVKANLWIRVLIALVLLFVLNMEKFMLMIISAHRDYVPNTWSFIDHDGLGRSILALLLKLMIFVLLIWAIDLVIKRSKRHVP
jgi:molybdopterin-containing oxidoreductase family membrane subunit